jgi:hypothetical protein
VISDYLKGTTPEWVRLCARNKTGKKLLSNREIAAASGLCRCTVRILSKSSSWDRVPIGTADKFLMGCNYNPSRTRELRRMFRRKSLLYLRRAKPSQRKMIARILKSFEATAANAGQNALQQP